MKNIGRLVMEKLNLVWLLLAANFTTDTMDHRDSREIGLGEIIHIRCAVGTADAKQLHVPVLDKAIVTVYTMQQQHILQSVVGHYIEDDSAAMRDNLRCASEISSVRRSADQAEKDKQLVLIIPGYYRVDSEDEDNLVSVISDDSRELIDKLSEAAGAEPLVLLYRGARPAGQTEADFRINFDGTGVRWAARSLRNISIHADTR